MKAVPPVTYIHSAFFAGALAAVIVGNTVTAVAAEVPLALPCPTPITLVLSGIWAEAVSNPEAVARMQANPQRKSTVAALYQRTDGASVNVIALGTLDDMQGKVSIAGFGELGAAARTLGTANVRKGRQKARDMAAGSGASLEEFLVEPAVVVDETRFYLPGYVQATRSDGSVFDGYAAGVYQLIQGCVVTANLGLPIDAYSLDDVAQAISDISFK